MRKLWLAAALFINAAMAGGTYSASVTISWTSPGDDGNIGTATAYDLRYAPFQISESNWTSATVVQDVPLPLPAGNLQGVTIDDLVEDRPYYFAIRAVDEVGNWSDVSNNAAWSACQCIGSTGNVDGDPDDRVNVSDLSELVSFLFLGMASVACPAEANINGDPDGTITVSDLVQLVEYLFGSSDSRSLAACP